MMSDLKRLRWGRGWQRAIRAAVVVGAAAILPTLALGGTVASGNGELPWVTEAVSAPNVHYRVFHSPAVGGPVSFHVYLPPAYAENPDRRFPVLFYLHGLGGGVDGIAPMSWLLGQGMAQGHIPPLIVVFPNGLPMGMWCNSKDGQQPVESMLIEDLIPYVDSTFRTINARRGRAVEGFSMGGYGAARLGLKYHHLFGGFSMLGAGPLQLDILGDGPLSLEFRMMILNLVYGGDPEYFEAQSPWRIAEAVAEHLPPGMPIRQAVGTEDHVIANNRVFHEHLVALGIEHEYHELPGVGHQAGATLVGLGEDQWSFYNAALDPTQPIVEFITWLQVGVHAPGLYGSRWRTDLGLRNTAAEPATVEVRLHPSAGGEVLSKTTQVAAGAQSVLEDVVGQLGYTGSGALEVVADRRLVVTSRTYTLNSEDDACHPGGTFGQYYGGYSVKQGLAGGESAWLAQLAESSRFRTNLALTNMGREAAVVQVELFDGAGMPVGDFEVTLAPGRYHQEVRVFANRVEKGAVQRGSARVRVGTGSGIIASASVIDNLTNDPTTIPMLR